MYSSDVLDGQLSFRRQLAVRAHLAICWKCRRFMRQMRVVQRVVRALPDAPSADLNRLAEHLADLQCGKTRSEPRPEH